MLYSMWANICSYFIVRDVVVNIYEATGNTTRVKNYVHFFT